MRGERGARKHACRNAAGLVALTASRAARHHGSNELSGPLPTELGNIDKLSSNFQVYANDLSSTIPSQLGQLVDMRSYFYLYG